MRTLTVLLLSLCSIFNSYATELSVSGSLLFGENQEPLPGFEVELFLLSIDELMSTVTEDDGSYTFTFEHDFSDSPTLPATVSVVDFCTGTVLFEALVLLEDFTSATGVDLIVCSDINPPPPPEHCEAFFFVEQIGVDPFEVQFFDLSSTSTPIDSWAWDFGDGNTSDEASPIHTYAATGIYEVSLSITSDTCTSTYTSPVFVDDFVPCDCDWNEYDPVCIEVAPGMVELFETFCYAQCAGYGVDDLVDCSDNGFDLCEAFFSYEAGVDGLTLDFFNLSFTYGDSITSFEWTLPDGTASSLENPSFTFAEPGAYVVALTIVTESGCTSTYTQPVWVENGNGGPCNCDDVFDPVCVINDAGVIITLPSACVAICSGYGPEDIYEDCNFDDCDCPLVFDPVCVELIPGITFEFPNACVAECEGFTADDFVNCEGDDSCICPAIYDPVCVVENGDTLSFLNPCYAGCEGFGPDQFMDCNIDPPCGCDDFFDPVCVATPSGQILTFPNACFAECEGYDASVFFDCDEPSDCNCYQVYAPVCVTLPNGIELVFQNDCYAECEGFGPDEYAPCNGGGNAFCEAIFDIVETDVPGQLQFLDYSFADDGEITEWFWDFGDGNTSTEQNPVHNYTIDGMVEVQLTITTSSDCSSTLVYPVFIGSGGGAGSGPDCQAMFSFEQDEDDLLSFTFMDMSMGNDTDSWFWNFGDGNSSTEQNPVHTYTQPGLYLVTLTTTSGDCTSSMSMIILTDFDIFYDEGCLALFLPFKTDSLTYAFLNLSSDFEADYFWDFGDGTTSTEAMPVHTYAAPGNYGISLTMTTLDGCVATFTVTINPVINGFTGQPSFLMAVNTEENFEQPLGQIKAYPNPAHEQATLDLNLQQGGAYELRLLNLNGQALWQQSYNWSAGRQQIDLDLSDVPAGMLMLQVRGEQGTETLRLIKQ
ncbi:MAG: PKD domain-containing protein [Phaeodactylibacter sp.]|uniref:PKD domain-containing protein n=1 Tax=Phaeodactylibacter sp. TaxID=1940289 RepID=UPI0032EECBF6